MAFPDVGDRISVRTTDKNGTPVTVAGVMTAIRPHAREVLIDDGTVIHRVPWQDVIDKYGE